MFCELTNELFAKTGVSTCDDGDLSNDVNVGKSRTEKVNVTLPGSSGMFLSMSQFWAQLDLQLFDMLC